MTVEAVFVIPIVIFVIFALMYLTFYLHDRVRVETIMEKALGKSDFLVLQRGNISGNSCNYEEINEEKNWGYFQGSYEKQEEEIKEYLEGELNKGFFLLDIKDMDCEIDGFAVKIKIEMRETISLNPVKSFWGEEDVFKLERERILHSPEEILRIFEGLEMVMNYAEDFNFIKNYIANNKAVLEKE